MEPDAIQLPPARRQSTGNDAERKVIFGKDSTINQRGSWGAGNNAARHSTLDHMHPIDDPLRRPVSLLRGVGRNNKHHHFHLSLWIFWQILVCDEELNGGAQCPRSCHMQGWSVEEFDGFGYDTSLKCAQRTRTMMQSGFHVLVSRGTNSKQG